MACDCANHDPNDPTHKPCGPCAQAMSAIVPRSIRLGAAVDDLTAIQQFLHQIASTQTFPTDAELAAAQQAAANLSTELPGATPSSGGGGGSSMTTSPAGVILMVAGAALVGGSVVYLAATRKRRRR